MNLERERDRLKLIVTDQEIPEPPKRYPGSG